MMRKLSLSVSIGMLVVAAEAISFLSPVRPSRGGHTIASLAIPEKTKAIFQRSCKDCHSNETTWPWYSRIQPVAMWIRHDVSEGRRRLDFSTWGRDPVRAAASHNELEEICDAVSTRSMPPARYLLMHSSARLTDEEINTICDLADSPP
jgi:Haem-binding domain